MLAYKVFQYIQAATEGGPLFEDNIRMSMLATESKVTLKYLAIYSRGIRNERFH